MEEKTISAKPLTGQITLTKEKLSLWQKTIASITQFSRALDTILASTTEQITEAIQLILTAAVIFNSSDVHFEPEEERVKLRIRLDGILHDITFIKPLFYNKLLSRIKLLAGLKINIANRSQDGRFSLEIIGNKDQEDQEIEIRVSALPSEYGEAIVMRVLNPQSLIKIEDLGIRQDLQDVFEKEISRPNGMLIVTGPTGSGKTTTLYAVLKKLQSPEIKIITIEDPIEYHLEGISQSQVNPESGYTFSSGLQAIVRQDPDVILVGEIRDLETAQIAIQASLTGHLVLSTLHTNNAAGTIARLIALGEKSTNIAESLNLVIAQRLVRLICRYCKEMVKGSEKEIAEIRRTLDELPAKIKKGMDIEDLLRSQKIPKAKGCSHCSATGYKGRIGIYEFLVVDNEIKNFIATSQSMVDLEKKACEKGMTTIKQDGFIKVLQGITTLEEVKRIAGE